MAAEEHLAPLQRGRRAALRVPVAERGAGSADDEPVFARRGLFDPRIQQRRTGHGLANGRGSVAEYAFRISTVLKSCRGPRFIYALRRGWDGRSDSVSPWQSNVQLPLA